MTTKQTNTETIEFAWVDVAQSLFAIRGINRGLWRLAVKVNFAALTAQVETTPGATPIGMPTGMIGMAGLALLPVTEPGLLVFDAAAMSAGQRPARAPAKKAAAKNIGGKRLPAKGSGAKALR